jgi:1-phosphatidylinositol phosphodiesterase
MSNFNAYEWMKATPDIDSLSLSELTLPGTHNAGCDWEASYATLPGPTYVACQDVPFFSQLSRGSRALDVRLFYDADASGVAKFRFRHGEYVSSRTLEDLISDVQAFLVSSNNEFIILAFHELHDGKAPFDFKYFNDMMLEHLGEHMIPVENRNLSLGQLKKISPLQRVLVAAPRHRDLDYNWFCRKIEHKWIGIDAPNTTELHSYITDVMKTPADPWTPWSLSATCFGWKGPQRILDELDLWFDPEKSDWAIKCNIINFDFIKASKIVAHCRTANLIKARKKT